MRKKKHKTDKMVNVILIFLFVLIIIFYCQYRLNYWKNKCVPFIRPIIPFGNSLPLVLCQISLSAYGSVMHNKIKKLKKDFGGYYIFTYPFFQPIGPELIKNILVKDFEYFSSRGFYYNMKVDPLSSHLVSNIYVKYK